MTKPMRFLPLALAAALASGCASLPTEGRRDTPSGFMSSRDQPHYQVSVRDGEAPFPEPAVFQLPEATLAPGALDAAVTPAQAAVVATHAARSVCLALAPWVQWTADGSGGRVALELQRIGASSSALAATSALLDAAVPGPFRLPAGLGALEVDSRLADATGATVLEMRWARGANPLLHRARASSIGDAWELAPSHARDLRDALQARGASAQPDAVRSANAAACVARYGKVSAAGRAASMFVPLSPEALDPSDDPDPRPARP